MDNMKRKNQLMGRWNRMEKLINLGITLAAVTFVFLFSKERLTLAFRMEHFPVAQLSVVLLFVTLLLIGLWTRSILGELQMFRDYFEEFVPPIQKSSFSITVSVAILFGVLGYFSNRIMIYSSIFVCFKLVELRGIGIRDSELRVGLKRARAKTSAKNGRRKGWDVIEKYYLKRPQVQLGTTVLFFSFVAAILGLSGELLSQPSATWLLSSAYAVMLINIVFAEIVYINWRRKRDVALGDVYS